MNNYTYVIENTITAELYIGVRTCSQAVKDDTAYMGSSKTLNAAMDAYGAQNFIKTIQMNWSTREEAVADEMFIQRLCDVVVDKRFYNRSIQRSTGFDTTGMTTVRKSDGTITQVPVSEISSYKGVRAGMATVQDKDGNTFTVEANDPRITSGELSGVRTGIFTAVDSAGNRYQVSKTDPRVLSGELTAQSKGRKWSEEARKKIKETRMKTRQAKEELFMGICLYRAYNDLPSGGVLFH